ncbi:MAG: 1,4-alpha-glucan branching protein GlgB [Clostridia bacterium]|nr:1,4-alpha-glucan branching protein GlgB [Clostridia bacterium]
MKALKRQPNTTPTEQNELAAYLFHQGTNYRAYEYLGAHRIGDRFLFRLWAPNADYVSVCGDFNQWNPGAHPMERITGGGIWEASLPCELVKDGANYKYFIRNGAKEILKADPYGTGMQAPPETASVIRDIEGYEWQDAGWLKYRKKRFDRAHLNARPINIYEVHLGSWKKHEDGSYYTYSELAEELAPYVKQMGYTHIELMPVSEYPYDGSWGYQVCGYYAPTARHGSPKEFMQFVDHMHTAGIGVILDWVPAHFPKDAHGLYEFDGQPLYEYQGWDRIEHEGWGTRRFDVGREEVQSFLISNAVYWLEKYHVDALRVDAVASMLYLDYDRRPGEWVPNAYGDNRCLEAIAFFKKLNSYLAGNYPDVMTIAEESTAFSNITGFENDGLGFSLKWNMGWMNDSLSYAEEDPLWRKYHHNLMNFSITYSFSEKFILPISHDEVVHGKKSLLDRMPGDYETKFAGTRAFMTYMMTHPGKKLLFMGCELGMFREWDYESELEWFLLDYDMHRKIQLFTAELNHFYLSRPELWETDDQWDRFQWIDADNSEQSILSYRRTAKNGREVVILINFLPVERKDFLLAVPYAGTWEEIFNTDEERFGGKGSVNKGKRKTEPCMLRGYCDAINITVPAMGAAIFHCTRRATKKG